MINRDIVEVYLSSHRNRQQLKQLFLERGLGSESTVSKDVTNWIKQFTRRWIISHGKDRFNEKNKDWLCQSFQASRCVSTHQRAAQSNDNLFTPQKQRTRGRKPRGFSDLSESSKDKYSKLLAKKESLESLLQSAEKLAHRGRLKHVAKVLNGLRRSGETYAKHMLKNVCIPKQKASVESSLLLKTRAGLSKSKYIAIEKFAKQMYDVKMLSTWQKVMQYRNEITPTICTPTEVDGALTIKVALRDMVSSDINRIFEIDEVAERLSSLVAMPDNDSIDLTLHVSAGVDSATGFSHYNQDKILKKDDSLLTEHVMPLMLVAANDQKLWVNPNPQSDTFCHARSMSWAKETDIRTKDIFRAFYNEVEDINERPLVIGPMIHGKQLRITVSAFYAMVDGKAANAIVNNRNTHVCPLCAPDADPRVGPAFFHSRLNVVEWLIRVAARKKVDNHPAQANPAVVAKAREISNQLEETFKMNVNRPKIGGSGSSNNGNMARKLLGKPETFAGILGVKTELIEKIRLISCLALSSNKLDAKKVAILYDEIVKLVTVEFNFVKRLPPCLHKYSHMPELIERLPYPLSFIDEQSGERCHKRYKNARQHLARKTSPEDNLTDLMRMSLAWSDPKLSHLEAKTKSRKSKKSFENNDHYQDMTYYFAEDAQINEILQDMSSADESEDPSDSESDVSELEN